MTVMHRVPGEAAHRGTCDARLCVYGACRMSRDSRLRVTQTWHGSELDQVNPLRAEAVWREQGGGTGSTCGSRSVRYTSHSSYSHTPELRGMNAELWEEPRA